MARSASDPATASAMRHLLATPSPEAGAPIPTLHLPDPADETAKLAELVTYFGAEGYVLPSEDGEEEEAGESLGEWEKIFLSQEGLLRFLVAMRGDVSATITRIEHALRWRRSQRIDDFDAFAQTIQDENTTGGQILMGYSKTQQPVILMVPARRETPPSEAGLMHLFFMLERAIDLMPPGVGKVTFLVDFAGKRKYSTPIGLARQWVDVLQKCYPERLGLGMITHIPWAINLFLTAAYAFMDPITKAKLRLNPTDAELPTIIPADQLLAGYGGAVEGLDESAWQDEARGVYPAYWAELVAQAQARRACYLRTWKELGGTVGLEETRWREAYRDTQAQEKAGPENGDSAETATVTATPVDVSA